MADPLDKNTIDALAIAMAKALNGQGGSRPYDQRSWGENRTPAQRVSDMRKSAEAREAKSMMATMTKLREGMKTQGKSLDQLEHTLKLSTSSVKRSMDIFGHNFEKAEKEFVKALNNTLKSNEGMNQHLRKLAGNIAKMEDVFQFDELTKALVEMSHQMEEAKTDATKGKAIAERLLMIQKHLDKSEQRFDDIDPLLKDFDELLNEITDLKKNGDREFKNQEEVGHIIKDWLKNNKISPDAQQRIKDLGLAGVSAAADKSARGLKYHASISGAAAAKLKSFAEKTFTATAALDLLIKAATMLYTTTKTAYGTGTEKGFGAVLARDFHAVANGVDPKVVQELQVKNAMTRSNMGRGAFDKQTYNGVNELTGITGDRNEAIKLQASLQSSLSKTGMAFDKMPGTIHQLNDSFLKLQYQTGMNAEQFGQLQEDILSDGDTRRQMLGLQDKEKAAMLDSINKRIVENTQLGYSIDQTKEQIKLLNKLFDPLKPKNRFENSVKENVFLRTQGVNAHDAQEIANMDRAGGADKYKAQLVSQGMSDKQAQDHVQQLSNTRANTAKKYQASLAKNDGNAFVNEALGDKLGMSSTYGSDAWLNGTPQTKEGNDEFNKSVGNFQDAVNNFSAHVLSMGDRLAAANGSIIGTVLKAAGLLFIAKQLGVIGSVMKLGKTLLTKEGLQGAIQSAKGFFSKGGEVAKDVAKAAGPEIELVNGIPRAKVATEAVAGGKGIFSTIKAMGAAGIGNIASKGKGVLGAIKGINLAKVGTAGMDALKGIKLAKAGALSMKMLKGGPGGLLAQLGLMGAQSYFGDKSTFGKVLNSNTVNGVANGAGIGGLIGSAFGGVGAVPGAAIGAGIGGIGGAAMDAWDYFTSPSKSVATPKTPTAPTMSLKSPLAQQTEQTLNDQMSSLPVNMTDAELKKQSEKSQRGDPQQETISELKKQNDLLSKIYAELKDHGDALNENGNKSVDAMSKLQRAMKTMGNGDPDLVAASKYN